MDAALAASVSQVSLVGVGKMGSAIGERILAAGYPLAVYNRTPEKAQPLLDAGASGIASLGDVLRKADVCVTTVSDDDALRAIALGSAGILAEARPGTTMIEMSTVSVVASEAVASAADEAGVRYLRAPISGNPGVVRGGTATVILSGASKAARDVDGLVRAIAPIVYYVGDGETARVVKLALQVMIGGTAQLMSEALVLAEAAAVDKENVLEVMGASAVGSPFVRYKTDPLVRGDYSATFTTKMMLKDVDLVLQLAADGGVSLPFTAALRGLLEDAAAAGHGDVDFMALYLQLRERTAASAAR
jgi:3-hydroxyisobutyrate dehydrogenase-like beta-hydroxyacid dehydrogenase